ncbi:chaplin family protein [Streptomyces sp. DSM 40750]|uniref:chaplin family protein n=1 Tax=Streptomyces sp. DSM 40750 TaxID=2801030 RepID=UPI0027D46570|nr:chaplin family protein [Streptomyces sp. DSM 40750]
MRQVTRKRLMTVAAASGVLAAAGGYAHADSGAQGSATNSPGVLSGNTVQAPVEAEVNVCGNTVNVVGLLNPAAGNKCSNGGGGGHHGGGSGSSHGGSQAQGHASDSPGVASGNTVQAPVDVPVNACGNTVNVVGVGNGAMGNDCSNGGGGGHHDGGPGSSHGGSQADGHASNSPGVASGNHVQAPVDVPVNVCGNTIGVVGIGNDATGNDCGNSGGGGAHENPGGGHQNPPGDSEETAPQPGKPGQPGQPGKPGNPGGEVPGGDTNTPGTQTVTQPDGVAQLAQTGGDVPLGLALSVGAGTLLGGALIYRKARAAAL